jgi:hypothetical protein
MIILPGAIIGGLPKVKAVTFDGTNDSLSRATAFTGSAAGATGTFSVWVQFNGSDAENQYLMDTGALLRIRREQSDAAPVADRKKLLVTLGATGPAIRISYNSGTALNVGAGWYHLLMSWDTAGTVELYINDALDTPTTTTIAAGNINGYTAAPYVGITTGGVARLNADMAEFWFDFTQKIDFTVEANRRKFITSGGRPANLGANGEKPTGSSPILYLKGPASNWGTNAGTGGNFTVAGTFTDAATPP